MRFGSVCSGIEAASVAWHPLGWKAAWLSEIEPFPSAVLAHHYPDVPNLGDMTLLPERILSGEVEAPDVFCGGTPCQAFSVAGLRNSLDDARGNLSLTFVGIANAIDHVRSVRSDAPAIVFWENVPGVLSTKDNAFGCFLGALAGEDDPIIPSGEKWTNAGCVYGPQRTVAWRVLDAQYFGVAQRRRRVFVVASARADFDPAAVLFEFDGVRRDTAPSREAGKTIAPCVTNSPPFSRTGNERVEAEAMVVSRSHWDGDYPHPTLNQSAKGSGGVGSSNQEIFSQRGAYLAPAKRWPADIASTLDTTFGTKQGLEDQHVNAGCPLFVPAQTFSIPAIGHIVQDDVASTMTRHTGSGAGETQNPAFVAQPVVVHGTQDPCVSDIAFAQGRNNGGENVLVHPISIHPHCIGRAPEAGPQGKEYLLDGSAYCMDSRGQPQAVAQPIPLNSMNCFRSPEADPTTGCGIGDAGEAMFTITKGQHHAVAAPPAMAVRRLTPVECERLQGFPDGYTNIPWRKKEESPDGPRYKALGNSWAVPVVRWIGRRIQEQINAA
jgi:DNA (cytosine-5)-methyltransferase 1